MSAVEGRARDHRPGVAGLAARKRLEKLIRDTLAATYRDRELGDVDLDQAATLAADIATIHLEHLQQPRVTPMPDGLELRYRVLIPWDHLAANLNDAERVRGERRK